MSDQEIKCQHCQQPLPALRVAMFLAGKAKRPMFCNKKCAAIHRGTQTKGISMKKKMPHTSGVRRPPRGWRGG